MITEIQLNGIVKTWDSKSGYGAILCLDPNQPAEFFVSHTGIRGDAKVLIPGQQVTFAAERGKMGNVAVDVVTLN